MSDEEDRIFRRKETIQQGNGNDMQSVNRKAFEDLDEDAIVDTDVTSAVLGGAVDGRLRVEAGERGMDIPADLLTPRRDNLHTGRDGGSSSAVSSLLTDCMDLPSSCSLEDLDSWIKDELDFLGSKELSGRCVACLVQKPNCAMAPCNHVPYCETCAWAALVKGGSGRCQRAISANSVNCPVCRETGSLYRIWLPEESGSRTGKCLQCDERQATIVLSKCRHCSLCKCCYKHLCTNKCGCEKVRCPVCGTVGPACELYRDDD